MPEWTVRVVGTVSYKVGAGRLAVPPQANYIMRQTQGGSYELAGNGKTYELPASDVDAYLTYGDLKIVSGPPFP